MSVFGTTGAYQSQLSRSREVKKSLLASLQQALTALEKKYGEDPSKEILSEEISNFLCDVLEAIFLHDLKGNFSKAFAAWAVGAPESASEHHFWYYVKKYTHRNTLKQINHLSQIRTYIGMCRAWLRMALNDGVLESYLHSMLSDTERRTLASHYQRSAYLRDTELAGIFKTLVQGLSAFTFNLSYNSHVLNMWSHNPLVLSGLSSVSKTPAPVIRTSVRQSPQTTTDTAQERKSSDDASIDIAVDLAKELQESSNSTSASFRTPPAGAPAGGLAGVSAGATAGACAASEQAAKPTWCPPNKAHGPSTPFSKKYGLRGEPWDPSVITPDEVESILRQWQESEGTGSSAASSCSSQMSHPDPLDARESTHQPDVARTDNDQPSVGNQQETTDRNDQSVQGQSEREEPSIYDAVIYQTDSEGGSNVESRMTSHTNVLREKNENISQKDIGSKDSVSKVKLQKPAASSSSRSEIVQNDDVSDTLTQENKPQDMNKNSTNAVDSNRTALPSPSSSSQCVPRSSTYPQLIPRRKSAAHAEISTAVATSVEMAKEFVTKKTDISDVEESLDSMYKAKEPRGNSLGTELLQKGWGSSPGSSSSEGAEEAASVQLLEEVLEDAGRRHAQDEMYSTVVQKSNTSPSLDLVNRYLNLETPEPADQSEASSTPTSKGASSPEEEFEVIISSSEKSECLKLPAMQPFLVALRGIRPLPGLGSQAFKCFSCQRQIGTTFDEPRLCNLNGMFYCTECHDNDVQYIPAFVIMNWDWRKREVSRKNSLLLRHFEEIPLFNVKEMNKQIYRQFLDVDAVRTERLKLKMLKPYIFQCSQSLADEFRSKLDMKDYYFENIDEYSYNDLLQIREKKLVPRLSSLVDYATAHVERCNLCREKGFICEICRDPKIIYPFDLDKIHRCAACEVVLHTHCRAGVAVCPKCERRRKHRRRLEESSHGQPAPGGSSVTVDRDWI